MRDVITKVCNEKPRVKLFVGFLGSFGKKGELKTAELITLELRDVTHNVVADDAVRNLHPYRELPYNSWKAKNLARLAHYRSRLRLSGERLYHLFGIFGLSVGLVFDHNLFGYRDLRRGLGTFGYVFQWRIRHQLGGASKVTLNDKFRLPLQEKKMKFFDSR